MNARRALHTVTRPTAHYVDFNNDKKYFCVALEDGFALYKTDPCQLYTREELTGSIGLATMLGTTQIFGLISGGDRPEHDSRRLTLYDLAKHSSVATISTSHPVVRARLSTQYIAVIFERSVSLYKHKGGITKLASYETVSNPLGLCCLGTKIMILPGRSAGQLQIVDVAPQGKMDVQIVPAHSSNLRTLELSPDEEIVASASDKGTLIRIHSTQNSARLAELRRGITPAVVLSIAISPSNDRLAVTSDTNTLHIFDLPIHAQGHSRTTTKPNPARTSTSTSSSPTPNSDPAPPPQNKYGSLSRLPFAPRLLSDTYSTCSCPFDPGTSSGTSTELKDVSTPFTKDSRGRYRQEDEDGFVNIVPGVPGGSPPKGVAAWIDDERVVIVNAGKEGQYERFELRDARDGRGGIEVVRDGWCAFLGDL